MDDLVSMASVEIDWRVENPFRLFVDPKDTEVHRATYLELSPAQRRLLTLYLLDQQRSAP